MIDLQKYKADMSRARDAGITFEAVRDVMNAHLRDDDDGTSFGRMVEQIRELALQAADQMAAEKERRERTAVVAWLHKMATTGTPLPRVYFDQTLKSLAECIERGEHCREEEDK